MTSLALPIRILKVPALLAPRWHTLLLASLFLGLALSGALFQHHAHVAPAVAGQHPNNLPLYLSLIAMEWGLVLYVWKGIRGRGTSLREIIGGRWARASDVLVDVAIALASWGIWKVIAIGWDHSIGAGHAAPIDALLPQGVLQGLLWIGVSLSAGFCEELVFRGYLQRQLTALTRSPSIGFVLQALLFGISHGYQGIEACLRIALIGAGMTLLALWRRSLRPGMVAHAWMDIAGGLFGI